MACANCSATRRPCQLYPGFKVCIECKRQKKGTTKCRLHSIPPTDKDRDGIPEPQSDDDQRYQFAQKAWQFRQKYGVPRSYQDAQPTPITPSGAGSSTVKPGTSTLKSTDNTALEAGTSSMERTRKRRRISVISAGDLIDTVEDAATSDSVSKGRNWLIHNMRFAYCRVAVTGVTTDTATKSHKAPKTVDNLQEGMDTLYCR